MVKEFEKTEKEQYKQEIIEIMIENGKDERIPFNKDVIQKAVEVRNEIAKKEAVCYLTLYERLRRLLSEIDKDEIKIEKYKKALRDCSIKLTFLKAQRMYIVSFLDNERMSAVGGPKVHQQLMEENCQNFILDTEQIENLYGIIVKRNNR